MAWSPRHGSGPPPACIGSATYRAFWTAWSRPTLPAATVMASTSTSGWRRAIIRAPAASKAVSVSMTRLRIYCLSSVPVRVNGSSDDWRWRGAAVFIPLFPRHGAEMINCIQRRNMLRSPRDHILVWVAPLKVALEATKCRQVFEGTVIGYE